ncbi:MAG: HEAT repeat domain-containing protein [Planctomycetes bacterium]|nr:HEAT repeat domain-containing protein [Planctomycetota bacterium]
MLSPNRLLTGFAVAVVLATTATAQPANPLPPSAPGNPPDIPYLEEQWELLWYLNQDVLWKRAAPVHAVTADDRKRVIEALRAAAASDYGPERAAALMALAKTGDPIVLDLLQAGVDDANLETRRNALLALGVLGDASAVDVLATTLDAKAVEGDLRLAAAFALGLLRTPDVEAGGASPARAEFERRLEPKAFWAADPRTQQGIAYGAGLSGDTALALPLAKLLKSKSAKKNSSVRAFLLLGIGKLRDRAHADTLFHALTDDDVNVRRSAILAVGSLFSGSGNAEAARRLTKLESRENDAVATNFANLALGFVGGPDSQRALAVRTFGERRSGVDPNTLAPRISLGTRSRLPIAGIALGIARSTDYRAYFERTFKEERDQRAKAAFGLGIGMLGHPDSARVLLAAFKDTADQRLRTYLALALGWVKAADATPLLKEIVVAGSDDELVPACAQALAAIDPALAQTLLLERLARETSAAARSLTLFCLGSVGDRDAIEPIVAVLANRDGEQAQVRTYAAIALGMIVDVDRPKRLADVSTLFNFTLDPGMFRGVLSIP